VRLVILLLLWCSLAGCSAARFAYDHLDAYFLWRSGSYLDLHGEEAGELEERIQDFLAWHRAQALPQYARIADDAARRMSRGMSRQDLVWGYDSLVAQAREGLRQAAERIAPILDRLTPEQVAHLEQRLAEDNRKFAGEFLRGSERERRERRARRTVEQLEDWVGDLSKAQVERVRQYAERAPLIDELRDRDRKRLQADLLRLVRARQARAGLPERAAHWQRGRDPAFVAANDARRQEYFSMILDVDRTLSAAQRARAVAQFRRYAEDMRVLASRAGPAARAP